MKTRIFKFIFETKDFFCSFIGISILYGFLTFPGQHFVKQKDTAITNLAEFQKDANRAYHALVKAANRVDNDIMTRYDTCHSHLSLREKQDNLFYLKTEQYNKDTFELVNDVGYAKEFFGEKVAEELRKFNNDIYEKDEHFQSCSSMADKSFSAKEINQRKKQVPRFALNRIEKIRAFKTPAQLEHYKEEMDSLPLLYEKTSRTIKSPPKTIP